MEINLKKHEVCELIEKYYKEKKQIDAKVKISAMREPTGLFEVMGCVTRVEVTKKVNILGLEKDKKEYLSDDEVLGIFNELLKDSEYQVINLSYDAGVNEHTVGYYMDEHAEYRAYFNGITLYVKEREKNKNNSLHRTVV